MSHNLMEKFRSMLEEVGIQNGGVELSTTQEHALELCTQGKNVLVIGPAGTGKSMLIREFKYKLENQDILKKVIVTATTGIAAYNVNGVTINSFMGIGTGEQPLDVLVKRVRKKIGVRERLRATDVLIIDEISMMSAELFEKINGICQAIRRSAAPFGGIQVLMTGDFYQLLPVFNKNSALFPDQDTRLIFESEVFKRYFNERNTVTLETNFRQHDNRFMELLLRLRKGQHTPEDTDVLNSRLVAKLKPTNTELHSAVHLVSSNKQANVINSENLQGLSEPSYKYTAQFAEQGNADVSNELKKELTNQFLQKGITAISLKKGARVMLIKNLEVEQGLVNGSVGTIDSFVKMNDTLILPKVRFDNGIVKLIEPVEWELEMSDSSCKATQLPLMLCWAITIHKSQSLTLDKAVLDLGDCFCEAQTYVALSRLRSLAGVYLRSFNPSKILVCNKVTQFLKE